MPILRRLLGLLLLLALPALAFDHQHAQWDALLQRHVTWEPGGHESKARYAGFKQDRAALRAYLAELSAVPEAEFKGWSKAQRLAFLINAYNGFTVELILTRYPDLKSIRDFGLIINNPWRKKFFTLLGQEQTLDGIEHGMIRAEGAYDDPRIHMAVNCASIGCPALRPEAYSADKLDAQLDDQVLRFVSDPTRNRYNADKQALEVSKIFDWYGTVFSRGLRGIDSVEGFFATYATQLSNKPDERKLIGERKAKIRFLDYDWALNDRKP
jgi:hypothetical protein